MSVSTASSSKHGGASRLGAMARTATMCRFSAIGLVSSAIWVAAAHSGLHGEEILPPTHSNTYNASATTFPGTAYPVAVKFDVPGSSATYQLTSFGSSQKAPSTPSPQYTKIAVRVWDSIRGFPSLCRMHLISVAEDGSTGYAVVRRYVSDHIQVSKYFLRALSRLDRRDAIVVPLAGLTRLTRRRVDNYGRSYQYPESATARGRLRLYYFWFSVQKSGYSATPTADGTCQWLPTLPRFYRIHNNMGMVLDAHGDVSTATGPSTVP